MDIRMPEMDGITATAALRRLDAPPQVIVLTTFQADEQVMSALRAGADGFLLKDTPPAEIVNAVRLVAAGEAMLSPSVTRTLLSHLGDAQASDRRRFAAQRLAVAHRPRAGGRGRGRVRRIQRGGGRVTVHERGHRQSARIAPVHQARRRQPGAHRDRRARRRPVLTPLPQDRRRNDLARSTMVSWAGPVVLARFSYGRGVAVERGMYCGSVEPQTVVPGERKGPVLVLPPEAEVEDQVD